MTTIDSFVNRLKKIGINVELEGNYPWVYLRKINDVPVKGNFLAEWGFTVFFRGSKFGSGDKITDTNTIFNKIRETLNMKNSKARF